MSKIPDLFNISQLEELTGIERRTISKTLESNKVAYTPGAKNAKLYKPSEALPVLYKPSNNQTDPEADELTKEKLLHATAKRKTAELELAERMREVVPINEVTDIVGKEYEVIRAQFRALPSKLAKQLSMSNDASQVFDVLKDSIDAVLSELSADAQAQEIQIEVTPEVVEEQDVATPS